MEQDASAFAAAVEDATDTVPTQAIQQLKGRFRFLWGMYKAHSEVWLSSTAAALASRWRHIASGDHQQHNIG